MKNKTSRKAMLSIVFAAGLAGGAWQDANACASEPVMSSVCIMAAPNLGDFNRAYLVADGRLLSIPQSTALFSLIGKTYGGNGTTDFAIPDLRGRVVIGSGQGPGLPAFTPGQILGQMSVTLTSSQLPAHAHTLGAASVNLAGVNVSGAASGLEIKASANAATNNPAGAYPGTTGGTTKIYSTDAPTVAMNAGVIGGNLNLKIADGTVAPLTGQTDLTGGTVPVSTVQPSLVMRYNIAHTGIFPSRD